MAQREIHWNLEIEGEGLGSRRGRWGGLCGRPDGDEPQTRGDAQQCSCPLPGSPLPIGDATVAEDRFRGETGSPLVDRIHPTVGPRTVDDWTAATLG